MPTMIWNTSTSPGIRLFGRPNPASVEPAFSSTCSNSDERDYTYGIPSSYVRTLSPFGSAPLPEASTIHRSTNTGEHIQRGPGGENGNHTPGACSDISWNSGSPNRNGESGMSHAQCECAAETQWNASGPNWRCLAMGGAPDSDSGDSGDALQSQVGTRMRVAFLARNDCEQNIERWLHDQAAVRKHKDEMDAWNIEEGTAGIPRYERAVCVDSDGGRTCAHFCVCQHAPSFIRSTRPSPFAKVKKRWYDGVLLAQNYYSYGNPHNPHIIEKSRKLTDAAILYQRQQKTCRLDAGDKGYVRNDQRGRQMPVGARWRGRLGRMVCVMNEKRVRMREAFERGEYAVRGQCEQV